MLISFTVENHRSIRDRATLDLRMRRRSGGTVRPWDGTIAPVAAVYGPNASGKSALWSALGAVPSLVRDSYRQSHRRPQQGRRVDSATRRALPVGSIGCRTPGAHPGHTMALRLVALLQHEGLPVGVTVRVREDGLRSSAPRGNHPHTARR